jgi:hypothetical protein
MFSFEGHELYAQFEEYSDRKGFRRNRGKCSEWSITRHCLWLAQMQKVRTAAVVPEFENTKIERAVAARVRVVMVVVEQVLRTANGKPY